MTPQAIHELKPVVPIDGQSFSSEQDWINRASRVLTAHPEYNNAEHGKTKGWRGHHFTALCFDQAGNRMRNGGDFMRATKEGTYPVWWIWPDQFPALIADYERMRGALEKIERWFGEFPETARFWPNEDGSDSDSPMSYSSAWGSNGERDYMRSVARQALTQGELS